MLVCINHPDWLTQGMFHWCITNLNAENWRPAGDSYIEFDDEQDALAFKLKFGL